MSVSLVIAALTASCIACFTGIMALLGASKIMSAMVEFLKEHER